MDNRAFRFLLITFAVCTTMTESFPRFLTRIPDDLSKSEESSEEESGSYSLETQQQQVSEKVDQFPAQSTSAEQQGDNQFMFTSSGEQFTIDPENSGSKQTEILFTGNPTASDKTGTVIDRQNTTSSDNADTINGAVTSSSHTSTSSLTSGDSLSITKTDSLTKKTAIPFTENSERTTKNPNFELETQSTSDKSQSIPIESNPINSQFTTLKSVETTAGRSFETSDKITQEEVSSTSEDKNKSHVIVTLSERSNKEGNGSSALQQKLNSPLTSSENTSNTSDRCDSTTFVKPTADSEPTNAGKCGAFITDPKTPRTQFDMINTSTIFTASSEPEKQAAKNKESILNNKSTFESNTGGALDLSSTEPIVTETSENKKTTFSTATGSQHLDKESITESSDSIILTSSNKSSTNPSSFSLPVNTVKEESVISTASDDLTNTEVTESADVTLPDLLVKNEHLTDNEFLVAPPFLSKHKLKDAHKILYEFHTSNTTHDHLNLSDAGIPHNVLDEHTIHEQHDSPHTDASSNLTGNPHHTIGGDEPLLPHSRHMHDSPHTKPTSSPQHIIAGNEPQIPHSHRMCTSHHTKPEGSPQHVVGGDEPQLPHSHHMKTLHHTSTDLHHIIGGDEPKLPHSHHMNATHTNTSANVTGAVNQVTGTNEPELPDSSHEHASPHILRESITAKDPVNRTSHSIVGERVSGGNLSEQSESEVQRFIDTENNERTTEKLLTESPNEDNLQPVHNERPTDSSFISPVFFRNSKHASGLLLPETVQTDPSIKPTIQTPLIDTSVADYIGQVSSDELIIVSDEQYPSENDEFPIRNLNSQGSEQPQESVADIQFSDKPTVHQEHITDNSNSSDKQTEISQDSSVQSQGSSSFTSSSISSVTVKTEDTAQQDATFPSGDILPKKQANGDLQYFIEQVIYPKQISSDVMNKQVSNEPSDIKTIQSTKTFSEPSEFESHSKPCNCTQTTDKPLSTQTNTLADKQSKSTQSATVTDITTEKLTNIQSAEEHRFTITEILSTVPDDDNDTPNHGGVLAVLAAHDVDKTVDPSSVVSNVPINTDSSNEMTGTGSSFQGGETAVPDFLVSKSNDNTQHSILDGKQTGNTVGYNTGRKYYCSPISTTKSTTSPTSLGTTSISPDVDTTSSSTPSQSTTEDSTSSTSGSTSSGTTSTYPDVESTSSMSPQGTTENSTSSTSGSTSSDTTSTSSEETTSSSSQGTTENLTSRTSGSTSSGTTNTYPDVETTSSSISSQGTTENSTSSISGSTSSDTTSTYPYVESTSSSMSSQGTTENPTSSTSGSTLSGTTSSYPDVETTSSSMSSQGTTENTSGSTSSDTSSTYEEITSSSSSYSQGTTKNSISSTSSSTSSGSASSDIQSTTPDYYTKTPPYGLLAPESSVNMNMPFNRGYLATTNKQSIEHFQSTENTDKDNIFSPTLTSDQATTSFQTSDSSEIKFEHPPKPYIGIKRSSKGGDRHKMFYSKPWYYVSEGQPLQNSYKNFKN